MSLFELFNVCDEGFVAFVDYFSVPFVISTLPYVHYAVVVVYI
jgi:hypothetical protein